MISCFTVTQEGRLPSLARAVADFSRQTARERELVILHDGGPALHSGIVKLTGEYDGARIDVVRVPGGQTLGTLRNAAIDAVRGEYVCQWDDDDRYHPRRLEVQLEALRSAKSEASFLCDQLHLFAEARETYWDDWYDMPYPLNFVPGTLLARRESLPRYPDRRRGEDTRLAMAMLRQGSTFARVREQGYLYVYIFDGANTFDHGHHAALSLSRRFRGARLVRLEAPLRQHVADYEPPLGAFTMPYDGSKLEFA
jgi:glycosyltransferase involved in cell wall biosynthesis